MAVLVHSHQYKVGIALLIHQKCQGHSKEIEIELLSLAYA